MNKRMYIRSTIETDDETGEPLFWSNDQGWVDFASASPHVFVSPREFAECSLPIGGEWVAELQRFSDAYMIQQGACNPAGVARSLVAACDECIAEGVSQRDDPAVRMIVHQLAYLMDTRSIDTELTLYQKLLHTCEDKQSGHVFVPT